MIRDWLGCSTHTVWFGAARPELAKPRRENGFERIRARELHSLSIAVSYRQHGRKAAWLSHM